jgi:hypothetical protein
LRDIQSDNKALPPNTGSYLFTMPLENENILPQVAAILRIGFCVYGRK